jgi:excinuclease UvrABC nuclease subunit
MDVEQVPVSEGGAAERVAAGAGVYAILDAQRQLQYVGLAKNVAAHVRVHLQTLPQHTAFVQARADASWNPVGPLTHRRGCEL